jgi:cytochrome c-type biogenesis protein CcmE
MTETKPNATTPPATPAAPPVRPPRRKKHARYVVGAIACAVIVVWMLTELRKAEVFLRPVSYAVAHRDQQGDHFFRMGGTVVAGSIHKATDGTAFTVTEGGATAAVVDHSDPPDLFKNCAPVVVEGHWSGTVFEANQLLIRHGSNYDASSRVDPSCKAPTS